VFSMLNLQASLTTVFTAFLAACTSSQEVSADTIPTRWQFESYACAFECDPMLEQVLKPRLGQLLDFNAPQKGFDLFSECRGILRLNKVMLRNREVIDQLNQTTPPDQQFTRENTGLRNSTLMTAQAICHRNEKKSSTFWVVSLTGETMKVYFEGASFLDFKALN
jgi:hypothetical protein